MSGEHETTDRPPGDHRVLQVQCPHCHSPIDTVENDNDLHCSSCGNSFRVDNDRTQDWQRGSKLTQIGKFELLEVVGRGAFGTVYRARDTQLHRIVAVKVPRAGQLSTAEDEDRFVREARNVAQLQHPAIVPVFEVGRGDEFSYIVSEFVQGITLADAMTGRRLTFRESAQLVAGVAAALAHAHAQGVVHRDLKPSNIMLSSDGSPRVMDFGLAKRDAGEVTMTIEGQVLGTPAYMSPEQASGQAHHVDGRSDIYALGCVLYELLSGELPFRGNQRMLLHQVLHDEPRAPRSLNDRIPRDLETICLKAMAKEPARRYQTADALADDLSRYLSGSPITARPVGGIERGWRWCRRNPVVASLSAAVFLALASGAIASNYFAVQAERRAEEAIAEKARADEKAAEAAQASAQASEEAQRALVEAEKANTVSQFLAGMFEASAPLRSGGVRFTGFGLGGKKGTSAADQTAREILDRGAKKIVDELKDQPAVRAALLDTIGNVYIGLGLPDQADPLLTEALAIRRKLHPEPHLDTAASLYSLAVLRVLQLRLDQSAPISAEALAIRQQLLGDDHQDTVDTKFVLAFAKGAMDMSSPEVEALMQDVVTWRREHLGKEHLETIFGILGLAGVLVQRGDLAKGSPLLNEATALLLKNPETKLLGLAVTETIQSILMDRMKQWDAAADASGKAVRHFLEFESKNHPTFYLIAQQHLNSLIRADRRDELRKLCRAEFEELQNSSGSAPLFSISCLGAYCQLAIVVRDPSELEEAEKLCRELLSRTSGSDGRLRFNCASCFASVLAAQADLACDRNDVPRAQSLCAEAIALAKANLAQEVPPRFRAPKLATATAIASSLGAVLHRTAKPEDAEALYRETLTLADQPEDVRYNLQLTDLLADLKCALRKHDEAEVLYRDALNRAVQTKDAYYSMAITADLAYLKHFQGKEAESETLYREALRLVDGIRSPGQDGKSWQAFLQRGLAECLKFQSRWEDMAAALEDAILCDPSDSLAPNSLAWLRATCPDKRFRDGPRAVELAAKICERLAWQDPYPIDTLAAAYAEAGRLDEAIRCQIQALELMPDTPSQQQATKRLESYQATQRERATSGAEN